MRERRAFSRRVEAALVTNLRPRAADLRLERDPSQSVSKAYCKSVPKGMDPPGDQNDGFVLEGLNDDFVLKAAFGSGKQREPLSTVDLLDVVATPPCSEVVRAAAAAARPHGFESAGLLLHDRQIGRRGVSFSMEEMSLGLGAIGRSKEQGLQEGQEVTREMQTKRRRLGRPPQPSPSAAPLVFAPAESAVPTPPPRAARRGKRSAGREPPMCMELGRSAEPAGKQTSPGCLRVPANSPGQRRREEARDEFAATACICCGVGYLTLERRGGEGPDYTPYCQYCVWAEVGLVCRGCCRGGAGHPCGT